ncbi:MAG: peptide chain release factor 1 [Ruminococcaceae bacterium]|nr:peptide chain release factor 1 [Oscillospiraceae bacterium]
MIDKLQKAEENYVRIEESLSDPDIISNQEEYTRLMKEYKNLTPIIEAFRRYKATDKAMKDAQELMQEGDDDIKELAEAEFYEMRDLLEKLSAELKVLLLPKDENDDKNVIVEIRGGAGGEEAALFASVLYRMYGMYADKMGFKIEPLNVNETELGGIKEISFMVVGDGAYSKLKFESGVHRVQRVPETESQGRIHTSTVTVAVLPEADDVEVEINPADLKIETCKSSGAGGQHVNKTESAIRIIHKPSGIIVECQEERSQFKNRDKAMKMLKTKLLDIKQREQDDKIASARKSQVGTGDRSERIRTYNYPQGRVTDHRIGLTLYTLESFLNGDISQMIDELIAADTAEKLKESVDEN